MTDRWCGRLCAAWLIVASWPIAAAADETITWYVASMASDTAERTSAAFSAARPGVTVNIVRTSGQVAFQRLTQDLRAGAALCDVFSSTDIGHYLALKEQHRLLQFVPDNAARVQPAFRGLDPDGFFHVTTADLVVMLHNRDAVPDDQVPQRWSDLLAPRWHGKIGLAHPAYSGAMGAWAVAMTQLYGAGFLDKLAANAPQVGRSLNDTTTMITAGERLVGPGIQPTALRARARGNPIELSYPQDGALLLLFVSGIMANSRHPAAAKLFMEWLLGIEQSTLLARDFYEPLRPEVAPPAGVKPIDAIKTIAPDADALRRGIPKIIEAWRDAFGN